MKKFLLTVAALLISLPAVANEPRALVTDMIGTTQPMIDSFDELPAGTVIALDRGAEVTLTFYPTCEEVTVRGGKIEITDESIRISKPGKIVSHAKGECPGAVKLTAVDIINAAIITRAKPKPVPAVALRPVIALVGVDPAAYDTMTIRTPKGAVARVAMKGRKGEWPADAIPLEDGQRYILTMTGPGAQPYVAKIMAKASAPRITVLRPK